MKPFYYKGYLLRTNLIGPKRFLQVVEFGPGWIQIKASFPLYHQGTPMVEQAMDEARRAIDAMAPKVYAQPVRLTVRRAG